MPFDNYLVVEYSGFDYELTLKYNGLRLRRLCADRRTMNCVGRYQ
jgi:hypothetical protein